MYSSKLSEFIDKVSPGIQDAVRWFWEMGYETTDSGDGSNYAAGMEGAFEYDHVAIQVSPAYMIYHAGIIYRTLKNSGGEDLSIEATYFPKDDVSIILVSDPEKTGQLRKLKR